MQRLTDRRTAEALKSNAEKLREKGFDIPISDQRYIKLADYEDAEESRSRAFVNYDPDDYCNEI